MQNALDETIQKTLISIQTAPSNAQILRAGASIQKLILDTPFDAQSRQVIRDAYRMLNEEVIAVRSSGMEEDSVSYSFAGQFESYLAVKNEQDMLKAVKKCWASAFSKKTLT
jgi:pyruvate,water dikinase